jgi:hypothetical protein
VPPSWKKLGLTSAEWRSTSTIRWAASTVTPVATIAATFAGTLAPARCSYETS